MSLYYNIIFCWNIVERFFKGVRGGQYSNYLFIKHLYVLKFDWIFLFSINHYIFLFSINQITYIYFQLTKLHIFIFN